jgi:hypothetical protein
MKIFGHDLASPAFANALEMNAWEIAPQIEGPGWEAGLR